MVYGSGPLLTSNFDFNVTPQGDIETTSGFSELEKDIALRVANTLEEQGLGSINTVTRQEDLRIAVGNIITDDPRIVNLVDIDIEQDEDNNNQVNITVETDAGDGPFDAVIEV